MTVVGTRSRLWQMTALGKRNMGFNKTLDQSCERIYTTCHLP